MTYETVTGYCWPQSAGAGDSVALHVSSAGARDVQVEVARVGLHRDVVFSGTVPAGDHPVPAKAYELGCDWPAATSLTVGDDWRSGYYEVTLTIDVDGKRGATTPSSCCARRRPTPAPSCCSWPPTRGTRTTTSAVATCTPAAPSRRCSGRWRAATCTSRRAPVGGSPPSTHPTPT
jgi:hypothetical protein